MQSAGYTFLEKDKTDVEIKKLLLSQNYDRFEWSNRIFAQTGRIFFKSMIDKDDD